MTFSTVSPRGHHGHTFIVRVVLFSTLMLISGCISPTERGGKGRAAIVVQHSDGSNTTACVSFDREEIDGADLLDLSGISYVADLGNSMGSILCSIEGDGCDFPNEKCFCQCSKPGSCAYWSYFIKDDGGDWVYAPVGARLRRVHDGDVDAWIWVEGTGLGQIRDKTIIPDVDFEDICRE